MNVTSKQVPSTFALMDYAQVAANEVGVRLYNLRKSGKSGIAFQLKTGERNERRRDWRGKLQWAPKYQRLTQYERTSHAKGTKGWTFNPVVPGAVCWHGHRDFLRALYRLVPDAKVRTAFITYQNADHFEASYQSTWNGPERVSGGFARYARPYQDACTCDE